jgi:hypothetical protein
MEKKLAQEKLAIMFKNNHYQKNTVYCQPVPLILLKVKVACRIFHFMQHCTGYLCLMEGSLHKFFKKTI